MCNVSMARFVGTHPQQVVVTTVGKRIDRILGAKNDPFGLYTNISMSVTVTESCKEGGGQVARPSQKEVALLKRTIRLLTVAALMATMALVMAVPAFA